MFNAAMSLTTTAIRRDVDGDVKMCRSRVVLPEPRKPDNNVTGIGDLAPFLLLGVLAILLVDLCESVLQVLGMRFLLRYTKMAVQLQKHKRDHKITRKIGGLVHWSWYGYL
jgi:hypothetical protein